MTEKVLSLVDAKYRKAAENARVFYLAEDSKRGKLVTHREYPTWEEAMVGAVSRGVGHIAVGGDNVLRVLDADKWFKECQVRVCEEGASGYDVIQSLPDAQKTMQDWVWEIVTQRHPELYEKYFIHIILVDHLRNLVCVPGKPMSLISAFTYGRALGYKMRQEDIDSLDREHKALDHAKQKEET